MAIKDEKWMCVAHPKYDPHCAWCHQAKVNNIREGYEKEEKPPPHTIINPTPARKDDSAKPDMSLVTYSMIEPAAKILKFGEKKYGRYNYRNPNPGFEQRLIAATIRHLLQHTDGQELDSESNEPHLAHALASLMLIFDRRAHKKEGEEL